MEIGLLPTINQQLLGLDDANGAQALAHDVASALATTVERYEGDASREELLVQLYHLYDLFLACRPRMANIILDIQRIILHIVEHPEANRESIANFARSLLDVRENLAQKLLAEGTELFQKKRKVLIHSYSTLLIRLLDYVAEHAVKPDVLVAEQQAGKTGKLLRFLDRNGFKYSVVSEYSVVHAIGHFDIALFGALTLTSRDRVIMGPGSSSLISLLHREGVESFLILPTSKFSYWEEEVELTFRETRRKEKHGVAYTKNVFSHDTIPLNLFQGIITEHGLMNPLNVKELFRDMREGFFEKEKKIRELNLPPEDEGSQPGDD